MINQQDTWRALRVAGAVEHTYKGYTVFTPENTYGWIERDGRFIMHTTSYDDATLQIDGLILWLGPDACESGR